jgi:hypothetical protein
MIERFNQNCNIDHERFTEQEYMAHLQDWHGRCADKIEWIGRTLYCFEKRKHSGWCNYTKSGFPVSAMGEVFEGYDFW